MSYANSNFLIEDNVTGGDTSNTSNLYFGKRGGSTPLYFHGTIDDVRIYDRALSAEEVQALYNLGQ
ncbi:MAG: hypothetical protein EBS13_03180 [Verrucomicrobia bacterium]|nr:hypothetical protein [Verrucomicrobiota bacterium]